jgi:hypothetical protein
VISSPAEEPPILPSLRGGAQPPVSASGARFKELTKKISDAPFAFYCIIHLVMSNKDIT